MGTDLGDWLRRAYPFGEVTRVAHPRTIPPLIVSAEDRTYLDRLVRSRPDPARAVARAGVLVAYVDGASCPTIARTQRAEAMLCQR